VQNHAASRIVAADGISFFYINYGLSVSAAQTACAQRGSGWNLAAIESDAENTAVTPLITASTWIGLNDLTTQGVWAWSTGSPALYTNWNSGEPNLIGSERYVEIGTDGKWNNVASGWLKNVLCSVRVPFAGAPHGACNGAQGHHLLFCTFHPLCLFLNPCFHHVLNGISVNLEVLHPLLSFCYSMLKHLSQQRTTEPDFQLCWPQNHVAIRQTTVGSVTFYLVNSVLSWSAAQAACTRMGLGWDLATISSAAENAAVTQLTSDPVWIGLSDNVIQGTYSWVSGSASSYTNWDTGEPNQAGVERVTFLKGKTDAFAGKWNNVRPTDQFRYVCSVRASPTTL
jgi:hypothetical protein